MSWPCGRTPLCVCACLGKGFGHFPFSFTEGQTLPACISWSSGFPLWASALLPKCSMKKLGEVYRELRSGGVLVPGPSWGQRPCWPSRWPSAPASPPPPSVRPLTAPPTFPSPHPSFLSVNFQQCLAVNTLGLFKRVILC